jgi:hypothetical protein
MLRLGRRATQPLAALAGSAATAVILLAAGSTPALAEAGPGLQSFAYAGYHFEVPGTWPVFDLSRQPLTCVRFDLHAVYLGTPAANQNCPSWLLGATEALVIGPGPSAAGRQTAENPVTHRITATGPGIVVTATFDTDPAVITVILASAGLASPVVTTADLSSPAGAKASSGQGSATQLSVSATQVRAGPSATDPVPLPVLPATVANDVGLGFDTCTAPSSGAMQAWLAQSPYRAVGVYIGGADRACSQPNLTAAWVRQQAVAGWRFIPLYAGPQSAFGQITAPAQQGTDDASDAVAQAEQLGFGPGTPLYDDMESYVPAVSVPTLQFLSAWTTRLHQLGYDSGVYSSSGSGIADLAAQYGSGGYAMPDVIYDAWWNGAADTSDAHYQAGEWTGGRRIHQFSGNVQQSYGGVSMLIDQDYLDVTLAPATPAPQPSPSATTQPSPSGSPQPSPSGSPEPSPSASPASSPAATAQASAAVTDGNGSTFVFAVGPGHHLIEEATTGTGQWTRTDLGGDLTSAPSAVLVGSVLHVFYRGAGHRLWELTSTPGGFGPGQRLSQFGAVGAPQVVAQPDGVIDVFWRGYGGIRLWHAQYDPGSGWAGPQNLLGRLASDPDPVVTPSGNVEVFWMGGGDRNLWRVVRGGVSGTWGGPQDLGMGPLGGAPQAVPLPSGEIDVAWRRLVRPRFIEEAALRPGAPAAGPVNPGGALGQILQPWPVVAAGSEWLVFQGRLGGLRQVHPANEGGWTATAWVTRVAGLLSAPFAAAGPASAPLQVFWAGTDGNLWTEQFTEAAGWSRPVQLGAL